MCPKYAQNVTKHTNCAQIVSKHLIFLWTLVSEHMNHVQTATTCPKFAVNIPKLWTYFGQILGASAKYGNILKGHQLGHILDTDQFVMGLLRTEF